jgi:hypothetical protein
MSNVPNDDEVIIQGLGLIREGLVNNDLQKIYDGYNSISGEDLKPPQKSRLEKIRGSIKGETAVCSDEEPKPAKSKKKLVDEEANIDIKEHSQKGGSRFGRGKIKVITTPVDEKMAKLNEEIASKTQKMKRSPASTQTIADRFRNPDGDITYSDNFRKG